MPPPHRRIVFSGHAIRRMFERGISKEIVIDVLGRGEAFEEYPDDQPFPSRLLLGFDAGRPIHVVAADDAATGTCHIITVYRPDAERWGADYKTRRRP